jgi:hypothetical protein
MSQRRLLMDRTPIDEIALVAECYGDKEFQSPYRSTIPLLALLKEGGAVYAEVKGACGVPELCSEHLEYTVAPRSGVGRPSHTDLMLAWSGGAVAIEAKWTEPRYETAAEWLKKGASADNRRAVLSGWLELLQPHAGEKLDINTVGDCVYQMIHRAASACKAASGERPQLAYIIFTPQQGGQEASGAHYLSDLERFHTAMGQPANFPMHLFEVSLTPTDAFKVIAPLRKGEAETAERVRVALSGAPLFTFQSVKHHRVGVPHA